MPSGHLSFPCLSCEHFARAKCCRAVNKSSYPPAPPKQDPIFGWVFVLVMVACIDKMTKICGMHPDYEKYKASAEDREGLHSRLPKELAAKIRILATLENDSITNLITEGMARVIEAREIEPMVDPSTIQQRIEDLTSEIDILRSL